MANKYVSQRVKRTEDPRLIKGLAHYVDIGLPGTPSRLCALFMRTRKSPASTPRRHSQRQESSPFTPARTSQTRLGQCLVPEPCRI